VVNWTDSHNHLQFFPPDKVAGALAAMAAAGVTRSVVNATSEADWAAVAALAGRWPERVLPAFGVHPWWVPEVTAGWQERLRELLEKNPLASVGECGLDRRRGRADLGLQRAVFKDQLRLARDLGRTVSIHCVKAWGELLEALAATGPPLKFLMHSYGGSLEVARRLVPLGAYFSVSANLFERSREGVLDVFRQLPRDRLLVESDAPQRPGQAAIEGRSPADLPATGKVLAEALGMAVADLAALTENNARECWPGGWFGPSESPRSCAGGCVPRGGPDAVESHWR
jgi:TatD DNase family protein